jgi:hypothetical protein
MDNAVPAARTVMENCVFKISWPFKNLFCHF